MSWYHQAFYKCLQYSSARLTKSESSLQAKRKLDELIRFHIMVKKWVCYWAQTKRHFHTIRFVFYFEFRWFLYTAKVYSPFVLIQLICNMFVLASAVYQMDLVGIGYYNFADKSLVQ